MASQLTVRNVSPDLSRKLKALAEARGESVNSTVLHVLEDALGVDARRRRLERYATWTEADAVDFAAALEAQRQIDDEAWR